MSNTGEFPAVAAEQEQRVFSDRSPWPLTIGLTVALGAMLVLGAWEARGMQSDIDQLKTGLASEAKDRKDADKELAAADVELTKAQAAQNLEVSGMKTDIGYIKEGVRRIENALTRGR